jgi:hypothetical protein
VPAVAFAVLIGLRASPDVRFLFPALLLLLAAGGVTVAWSVSMLAGGRDALIPLSAAAAALVTAASLLGLADSSRLAAEERHQLAATFQPVRALALQIGQNAADECFVATSYVPQVIWYSQCAAVSFERLGPERLRDRPEGERWIVLFDRGKRQPDGQELQRYLDLTAGHPDIEIDDGQRLSPAIAYRVEP